LSSYSEKIPLFSLFFFVRSFGLMDDCGQKETQLVNQLKSARQSAFLTMGKKASQQCVNRERRLKRSPLYGTNQARSEPCLYDNSNFSLQIIDKTLTIV
jgi:hypothetical protein